MPDAFSCVVSQTTINLVGGDITRETVDAIVNAANSSLMGGGGVDGAIHRAGGPAILAECKEIRRTRGECATGEAVSTIAGNLPAKHVIHTVGPVWHGGSKGEPEKLASAYRNSLKEAVKLGVKSVAFPSISTGIYSYPVDKAAEIAIKTIAEFCKSNPQLEEVRFVLFDDTTFQAFKRALENSNLG